MKHSAALPLAWCLLTLGGLVPLASATERSSFDVVRSSVNAERSSVDAGRAAELVHMVRQDCGACHGMHLNGGLGPALTPAALKDMPLESVSATIFHGRPGTPMPPWQGLLNETEARWIAQRLLQGFAPEPQRGQP